MRIVFGSNTLVSGFGWGGLPGHAVGAALSGQATLVMRTCDFLATAWS